LFETSRYYHEILRRTQVKAEMVNRTNTQFINSRYLKRLWFVNFRKTNITDTGERFQHDRKGNVKNNLLDNFHHANSAPGFPALQTRRRPDDENQAPNAGQRKTPRSKRTRRLCQT